MGNAFEREFCNFLFEKGYWVHNMAQNQAGQPADIIAVAGKVAYLIDCKVCSDDKFPLSRVEENQDFAMSLWYECGNGHGWFALKLSDERVYMISHYVIDLFRKQGTKVLSTRDITTCGVRLDKWLETY